MSDFSVEELEGALARVEKEIQKLSERRTELLNDLFREKHGIELGDKVEYNLPGGRTAKGRVFHGIVRKLGAVPVIQIVKRDGTVTNRTMKCNYIEKLKKLEAPEPST